VIRFYCKECKSVKRSRNRKIFSTDSTMPHKTVGGNEIMIPQGICAYHHKPGARSARERERSSDAHSGVASSKVRP
jgi:hypothetical protein